MLYIVISDNILNQHSEVVNLTLGSSEGKVFLLHDKTLNRVRRKPVASRLVELVLELDPVQPQIMEEGFHQVHHHKDSDRKGHEREERKEYLQVNK